MERFVLPISWPYPGHRNQRHMAHKVRQSISPLVHQLGYALHGAQTHLGLFCHLHFLLLSLIILNVFLIEKLKFVVDDLLLLLEGILCGKLFDLNIFFE